MSLTLRQARQIVDACVARADELGVKQAIAIVDPAGNPITLDRMDGVRLGREQFAQGKAFAAVFYRRSSRDSATLLQTAPEQYHGALSMFPGRIFVVAGGFPIMVGDELVGGIGVSGATGQQDEDVALAGLKALAQ